MKKITILFYHFALLSLFFCLQTLQAQQPTGNAWYGGGTGGPMQIADTSAIEYNGDTLALEAWIQVCDTVGARLIFGKQWCTLNTEYTFGIANGHLRWTWSKTGRCDTLLNGFTHGYWVTHSGPSIDVGEWNHVAVIHTQNGVTFWLNGAEIPAANMEYHKFNSQAIIPKPSNPAEFSIFNGTHPGQMGAYKRWDGAQTGVFKGYLDQFAIWHTLPNQLSQRDSIPVNTSASGLALYFDFENYANAGLNTHRIYDSDGQAPFLEAVRLGGGPYDINTVVPMPSGNFLGNDTVINANSYDLDVSAFGNSLATYLWDDGSTAPVRTIFGDGTYFVTIFQGACSYTDTIHITLILLPIELTRFSAFADEERVKLSWETAGESSQRRFLVQRSPDAHHFFDLLSVEGREGTEAYRQFSAIDPNPLQQEAWYRLKMIENDGSVEYSEVRKVMKKVQEKWEPLVYPNPASGEFKLDLLGEDFEEIEIMLIDLEGRMVMKKQFEASRGEVIPVEISELAAGLYFLQIRTSQNLNTQRLQIQ